MNKKDKTLISICGPTAIGKTALSITLAQELKTEILSCDSRQFFKELKIGTAPPDEKELAQVQHHFIHHLSIFDSYSVGDFERDALKKLNQLFQQYDTVIMVGGSGLYEKAVTEGLDNFPEVDSTIRERLNHQFETDGIKPLQEELKKRDPSFFKEIDIQNHKRLIRALEICIGTEKPYSSFRKNQSKSRDFNIIKIGLNLDRETLYERINLRVDKMMEVGLLEEAKQYYPNRKLNALQTVGYREFFRYFEGEIELDFAIEEVKKNTRRFAKRQLTWFKKDQKIKWFAPHEKEEILHYIKGK
ncbi:tRNA dimethylallyltransferase [Flavobacteriaceae bacterium UJ101]|nr:tRNA dimethylallyltransferase [Flavobacteriaceae bacterium UJ101]